MYEGEEREIVNKGLHGILEGTSQRGNAQGPLGPAAATDRLRGPGGGHPRTHQSSKLMASVHGPRPDYPGRWSRKGIPRHQSVTSAPHTIGILISCRGQFELVPRHSPSCPAFSTRLHCFPGRGDLRWSVVAPSALAPCNGR